MSGRRPPFTGWPTAFHSQLCLDGLPQGGSARAVSSDDERALGNVRKGTQEDVDALLLHQPADEEEAPGDRVALADSLREAFDVDSHRDDRLRDGRHLWNGLRERAARQPDDGSIAHDQALQCLQPRCLERECVRAVKRLRVDRERAAVQRRIDQLQEEGAGWQNDELTSLLKRKEDLRHLMEELT